MEMNNKNNTDSNKYNIIRVIAIIMMIVGAFLFIFGPITSFFDFSRGSSILDFLGYSLVGFFLFCLSGFLLTYARRKRLTQSGLFAFGAPNEKTERLESSSQIYPPLDESVRNMVTCEVCGKLNKSDAKFCNNCGEAL